MQRKHTELLACSFQHVNMKQRGSCSTSEQDWSPCCSFYWMCCITDSQLMKWVSVNTDVFFSQQVEGSSVKVSVKRTVCVDGGWAVSWGSRGWSSSSLCVERLSLGLVAGRQSGDRAPEESEEAVVICNFTTRWPSLPIVFIHMNNVFIEMTQHKQNIQTLYKDSHIVCLSFLYSVPPLSLSMSPCVLNHILFVYDLKVPGFTSQIDLVQHKVKHNQITLSLKSEFCLWHKRSKLWT